MAACREAEIRAEFSQRRWGDTRQAEGRTPRPWKWKRPEIDTSNFRPLSSLTTQEQQQLVLNHFVAMEKSAVNSRRENEGEITHETIDDARIDLAHCEGSYPTEPINWESLLIGLLISEKIHADNKECEDFKLLCNYFKHASIENAWRNVSALEGNIHAERDRRFKGYGFESESNADLGSNQRTSQQSKTIEQLCSAFLESKTKEGRSKATLNKYPNTFRVVKDFWGENRAIESISREDAVQIVEFLTTYFKEQEGLQLGFGNEVKYCATPACSSAPRNKLSVERALSGTAKFSI